MKQKRMAPPFQRGGSGGAKKRGALNRKQHNKHQAPSTQISRESLGFRIFLFLSCDWRSFLRQWGSFHPLRSQRKAFPHCRDLPLYHIKFKRSPRQRQSFELLRSGLCWNFDETEKNGSPLPRTQTWLAIITFSKLTYWRGTKHLTNAGHVLRRSTPGGRIRHHWYIYSGHSRRAPPTFKQRLLHGACRLKKVSCSSTSQRIGSKMMFIKIEATIVMAEYISKLLRWSCP